MDTGELWLLYKALCKRKLRFSLWFQHVALKCSRLFKELLLPIPHSICSKIVTIISFVPQIEFPRSQFQKCCIIFQEINNNAYIKRLKRLHYFIDKKKSKNKVLLGVICEFAKIPLGCDFYSSVGCFNNVFPRNL